MSERVCRWGILSAAGIAKKNWQAIRLAGNAQLMAVASRDIAKSRQFIAECQSHVPHPQVPVALGSYEELLASKEIDAVYIPLPTGVRKNWVVRAAHSGKHVLCEKPVGCNAQDVAEMVAACRANNVQFMDGVMFMHSGRMAKMREALDDGTSVGQIRRITSQFSFHAPEEFLRDNIRMSYELEPLGCLGDLGWYNTRFTLWTMQEQLPEKVSGRLLAQLGRSDSTAPVPMEFSGEMWFAGGVSASFFCSFQTNHQQWAHVSGTKGLLRLSDFVLPDCGAEVGFEVANSLFAIDGCQFTMEPRARRVTLNEYSSNARHAQETNLFRTFSQLALGGKPDDRWAQQALNTQRVLDAFVASSRQDGKLVAL